MAWITTEVQVDAADVLHELSIEDIVEELKRRNAEMAEERSASTGLDYVRECLLRNNVNEALAALDTILFPRFSSSEVALRAYARSKKGAH